MQTKESINEYAKRYDTTVDFDRYFIDFRFRCLIENYKKLGDVLELGCANGLMTEKLIAISNSLDVVEGGEYYIDDTKQRLGKKAKDIKFYHSIFTDFKTVKEYDTIILSSVLHEVDKPVELLKKCKCWIKKSGIIYINVPNAASLHRRIGKDIGLLDSVYQFNKRDIEYCHQRIYDLARLENDVKNAGLKVKKKGGFFLKTLSNSQLENLNPKIINSLYNISKEIAAELCAEIYIFAKL